MRLLRVMLKGSLFVMQGVAIAIKCGATKAQFDATVSLTLHDKYASLCRSLRLKLYPSCSTENCCI